MSEPEGWAATAEVLAQRRALANDMVGLRLEAVRYVNIDYVGMERADCPDGPRWIDGGDEWVEPTWDFGSIHSVDFGIEFELGDGSVFSAGWDLPGDRESMFLGRGSLLGGRILPSAKTAIWNVRAVEPWRDLIGVSITSIELAYERWNEVSYWCRSLTIGFGPTRIDVVLGEAREPDRLEPSATNLAVLVGPPDRIRRR